MSGRDHLSGEQFQLFNPGAAQPRVINLPLPEGYADDTYTTAHSMEGEWEPSLIPFREPGAYSGSGGVEWEEINDFIPTEKITSPQRHVNRSAVEHQLKHANPLALAEDPGVMEYTAEGETFYDVGDGNHRVNAALRRGQLLTPANVYRPARQGR